MGQKVNPIGFRLGITRDWDSRWYSKNGYSKLLHEDIKLRKFVREKLKGAGVARVEIERAANRVKVNVHTARPGIVIGKRVRAWNSSRKKYRASRNPRCS